MYELYKITGLYYMRSVDPNAGTQDKNKYTKTN